ncbi:unnamed protein product [Prorocentrum cordatum]|uniref:Uncharacterized protein n=1 Tax=Prorocentrum cordatum TaxID=2364126 RepID=A0ABN9R969_9DINO|nr:unnamed protein product [Polarella glacialis]
MVAWVSWVSTASLWRARRSHTKSRWTPWGLRVGFLLWNVSCGLASTVFDSACRLVHSTDIASSCSSCLLSTINHRPMQRLAMFKEKALAYGDPEAKLDEVQPLKGAPETTSMNMDSLGDPWGLLLAAGTTIARQCMTLGLILFSVETPL